MAKSKYEYVKNFETSDVLIPNVWIVVRVDGKAFTRYVKGGGKGAGKAGGEEGGEGESDWRKEKRGI